jgi:hypothetical protein
MSRIFACSAAGVFAGLLVVGCSSGGSTADPYGPTPDFTAIQSRFDSPTGTFAKGSESSVFDGFVQQTQNQSSSFGIGGVGTSTSSGGTTTIKSQALHILGGNTTSSFCPSLASGLNAGQDSGSCACPSGGSLLWEIDGLEQSKASAQNGGPVNVIAKVRAMQCSVQNETVEGTEFAEIKSSGAPSASDLLMLLDVHLVATGAVSLKLDADFEYNNGQFWFSVTVNDGNVVVGSESYNSTTKTGTIIVRDRNDTWTCTLANGTGTCTSQRGDSRQI